MRLCLRKKFLPRRGWPFLQFNTLYQLLALKDDPALQIAEKLAFMPDLLMYLLTGELGTEYTIASTSQLVDPVARDWSWDIIRAFGLPERLFTPIQPAGSVRGTLLPEIAEETGVKQVPVIAVGTHDTASAVARCRRRRRALLTSARELGRCWARRLSGPCWRRL